MEAGIGGDFLDLVLTVDVGLEHQVTLKRDRYRVTILIQHLNAVAPGALGAIAGPVLGLHLKRDGAAAEIAAHDPVNDLGAGTAVRRVGHEIEDVADEFQHGGLAGAAPADDAIQPIDKLQSGTVQKSARDLDCLNFVVRQGTVQIDAVRRIPIVHVTPLLGRHQAHSGSPLQF
ncbi:hypothetical protein A6A05_01610 [Magnetospirillum moscoviense]|uniref:Uncharacterized protein n=1 Tax=Magnetospirillum moscoviense TaxID=1437059 RepID=A0A178MRM4_9PROT|nr:hypothetical protein A6A05_01610 [Magnetospirillum moscoviense]